MKALTAILRLVGGLIVFVVCMILVVVLIAPCMLISLPWVVLLFAGFANKGEPPFMWPFALCEKLFDWWEDFRVTWLEGW